MARIATPLCVLGALLVASGASAEPPSGELVNPWADPPGSPDAPRARGERCVAEDLVDPWARGRGGLPAESEAPTAAPRSPLRVAELVDPWRATPTAGLAHPVPQAWPGDELIDPWQAQ